jgi:WD40 repeat protein
MRTLLSLIFSALILTAAPAQAPKGQVAKLLSEKKIDIGRHHVFSVAFSRDGKTLAIGEDNVHLYDVSGEEPARLGELQARVAFGVHSMAFSPNGKLLAFGGGDHSVRVWDVRKRTEVFLNNRSHQACVRSVAFDPEGATLATGGDDRTVILWDVDDSGKLTERAVLRPADMHADAVRVVIFTAKGTSVVTGSSNGSFRTFGASGSAPKQINVFMAKSGYGDVSMAGSPDAKTWAITDHKVVHLLSANGTEIGQLRGHRENVRSVAFSPDGRLVASGGEDGKLAIWSVSAKVLRIAKDRPGRVSSVAFAPQTHDGEKGDLTVASGMEDGAVWLLKIGYRTK